MAEQTSSHSLKSEQDTASNESNEPSFPRQLPSESHHEDVSNTADNPSETNSSDQPKEAVFAVEESISHGHEENSNQEISNERLALSSSLPGSLQEHFMLSSRPTYRDTLIEGIALEDDEEPTGLPLNTPGSFSGNAAHDKAQERDASQTHTKLSPETKRIDAADAINAKVDVIDSCNLAIPDTSKGVEGEHNEAEPSGISLAEDATGEEGAPKSLFPISDNNQGLILSGLPGSSDEIDEEEKEFVMSLRPLSEVMVTAASPDLSGLPFSMSAGAESTALENANMQRWDLLDDEQSDVELDSGFGATKQESTLPLDQSDEMTNVAPRVSPFAPYIKNNTNLQPTMVTDADVSAKSENESEVLATKESEYNGDKSDSDYPDVAEVLGGLAAAAAGYYAKKVLNNNDSEEGSTSADYMRSPAKLAQPASQQRSNLSRGFGLETQSTAEDELTFDEGAGVGIGYRPPSDGFQGSESRVSEDTGSDQSVPRFTTAEKGKRVVRDEHTESKDHDMSVDDYPPVNSLTDNITSTIGDSPLFAVLSPTPASPKPLRAQQGKRGIYPAAPPAPWTSEPLTNKLAQCRALPSSRADTTSTPVTKNDPNLAFMSSARKHTPPTMTEGSSGKSLLNDFPDELPKSVNATTQPTVTLPEDPSKAPVLKGYYELPSIKKIDQWKSTKSLAPNTFKRLLINLCGLIVSRIIMRATIYRSIIKLISSLTGLSVLYWIEWGVALLFVINILEVIYSYMTSSNNFEYEPLTPSQRALLGLDPVISKVPGAVPIFKRSVSTPHNLTEKPIMSTYVSPSQVPFSSSRTPFQKPNVGTVAPEYRDAATILSKSMARSFNQVSVQDKADLNRLMKSLEAREELQNEWKGPDADSSKRSFGLHSGFGAPQNGLQGGVDMAVPDLRASINARGPVPQYRHALRTTLSKDHTSKTDLQKDGLYVVGHSKVLKNLKVSEQQLDRWVFNLRKWLWNKIVMHVCNEMEAVDEELAKQGLSYLDCKNATMFYCSVPVSQNVNGTASTAPGPPASAPLTSSLAWGAASVAAPRLPSAFGPPQPQQPQLPTSLQDLEARYGSSNIVKQRLYLEAYLAVPGCANRKYVVERLQAMGPLLTHFIWDSHGVTWDGAKKSWTPDLPSDAQIIMHLFMTYIDTNMPSQPAEVYDRFLFTYKHYVPMENKPDPTTALQIKQTSKFPPNYSLVVGGSLWEVVPKRLNVWYTMVLFIYMVMKENGGYLGQINIGTQWIGLGNVVEGYDL